MGSMNIGMAMSLPIAMGVIALIFCAGLYYLLLQYPVGPKSSDECQPDKEHGGTCELTEAEQLEIGEQMNSISGEVQEGARAFLKEEYFWLCIYVAVMFIILLLLFTLTDHRTDRTDGIRIAACFFVGAALSGAAGWFGMTVATDANVRTTQAARRIEDGGNAGGGLNLALKAAFTGGACMGFAVVGLGLLGLSIFFVIMSQGRTCANYDEFFAGIEPNSCESLIYEDALDALAGFGFGASSIALFARVAGGIYTKAADVGADLVGKVESGIPEDSPENPATIADNVGDNVGDVAGMGADLFESFVGSIIASATLANGDIAKISLPFWVAGAGVFASIVGFFFVSIDDSSKYPLQESECRTNEDHFNKFVDNDPKLNFKPQFTVEGTTVFEDGVEMQDDNAEQAVLMMALHKGTLISALILVVVSAIECYVLFDLSKYQKDIQFYYVGGRPQYENGGEAWRIWGCILIGLFCGICIGQLTEYCTSYAYLPVKTISKSGRTGPATVIIQGLGVGMISTMPPIMCLVATILSCNALLGNYCVSVAAVGMLSTLGITLATDAYGPVADNAGGLAEMVEELPDSVRKTTDALDALGNTTAATGKGFAIGSAVLTALSLLNAFRDRVSIVYASSGISVDIPISSDVADGVVLAGIVFGSMLPFLFGALTMLSVGLSAQDLMLNVRQQFAVKKKEEEAAVAAGQVPAGMAAQDYFNSKEWKRIREWRPKSEECVAISTTTSVKEMVLPGPYAILVPVWVGFLIGARFVMGLLAGTVGAGAMLAITMSNGGGAWDNSKKYIEIAGAHGGKGTETHKACVVGDTVGDPFKDTSGPALNILLKLMAMVSLTIATLLKGQGDWDIGWYALIPGFIIALTTFIYVYFIYGEAQADERRAEVVSEFKPKSPKKQTWHTDDKTPYFSENAKPANPQAAGQM